MSQKRGSGLAINAVIGGATATAMIFAGTGAVLSQDSANFSYDSSLHRLTVGAVIATGTNFMGPIVNVASANNATLNLQTTGALISRNVADANPCLLISQSNASSSGNICNFQFNSSVVASVDGSGVIRCQGIANGTATLSRIQMLTTGTIINRTVADANPNLVLNQNSGSATGDILQCQAGGVNRFLITYAGLFTLANQTTTVGAAAGTLTNCPTAGNPTGYLQMSINGGIGKIPYWT